MNKKIEELLSKCNYITDGTCDLGREEMLIKLVAKDIADKLWKENKKEIYGVYGIPYEPNWVEVESCGGDLLTVEEFNKHLDKGSIICDDGDGYWATETKKSDESVWIVDKPEWATHVIWYNV